MPECPYRPIGARVVIEVAKPETVTKGGIAIPDQAKSQLQEGTILAVGKGCVDVQVGEHVTFMPYVGRVLQRVDSWDQIIVLREDECHCVIDLALVQKLKDEQEAEKAAAAATEAEAAAAMAARRTSMLAP